MTFTLIRQKTWGKSATKSENFRWKWKCFCTVLLDGAVVTKFRHWQDGWSVALRLPSPVPGCRPTSVLTGLPVTSLHRGTYRHYRRRTTNWCWKYDIRFYLLKLQSGP